MDIFAAQAPCGVGRSQQQRPAPCSPWHRPRRGWRGCPSGSRKSSRNSLPGPSGSSPWRAAPWAHSAQSRSAAPPGWCPCSSCCEPSCSWQSGSLGGGSPTLDVKPCHQRGPLSRPHFLFHASARDPTVPPITVCS